MKKFFETSPIRARVIKAVDQYIEKVEAEYATKCDEIDTKAEADKQAFLDLKVNTIIGKII